MMNWSLFRDMETLRQEMDAIFGYPGEGQQLRSAFWPGIGSRRIPRLNLSDDADNFYLAALLPGVEARALDINLTGNTLTLSGERLAEQVEGADWQRQERGAGKFMRAIELPLDVATDKISAEYAQGVLRLVLPKAETAKPKRIAIKTAN